MKAVLISIQPYYVFLIIARAMGWNVEQEKTVEIRKNFPKATDWDKKSLVYCSRDRRSFKRIPATYQPLMKKLLGKVVGDFVCDWIEPLCQCNSGFVSKYACISRFAFFRYLGIPYDTHGGYDKRAFGWHISDLKIYDKPKELGEFKKGCNDMDDPMFGSYCGYCEWGCFLTRPPQSWMYVEEI